MNMFEEAGGAVDITKAEFLRGQRHRQRRRNSAIRRASDWAVLSCSRPVVDQAVAPKERHVKPGKTVKPKVYLQNDMSSFPTHQQASKGDCIIAINKDPEAPVFSTRTSGSLPM